MEEIAMQSGMVELGIWEVLFNQEPSISIIFLANVISVLIAIGLSRLLIQQGANFLQNLSLQYLLLQFS